MYHWIRGFLCETGMLTDCTDSFIKLTLVREFCFCKLNIPTCYVCRNKMGKENTACTAVKPTKCSTSEITPSQILVSSFIRTVFQIVWDFFPRNSPRAESHTSLQLMWQLNLSKAILYFFLWLPEFLCDISKGMYVPLPFLSLPKYTPVAWNNVNFSVLGWPVDSNILHTNIPTPLTQFSSL